MDDSFVFGDLLDETRGGVFRVEPGEESQADQQYVENTNILRTVFRGPNSAFELIDFAPRFRQFDRHFKPSMLVRILRPLEGRPLVRVRCQPVYDYGRVQATCWAASNHLEYTGLPAPMRLTTNLSLTYVQEGRPFVLAQDRHLVLTWGQPLESPLEETADHFLEQTADHWRRWVKRMRIPREYQEAVIRSALVLKLHQYEDTGALLAAMTTSLPEYPGSGRNWDYRFCWLRDSYFTLNAFERLGQAEEMEQFLHYLRNICTIHGHSLQPLYGINGETDPEERILGHLAGFRGERPVRIGNQAYQHVQNDVYGEMILAVSRILLDTRFRGTEGLSGALQMVELLLEQIESRLEEPDSGLWELRKSRKLHTFSLLTHWAGARRAAEIGDFLGSTKLRSRARSLMVAARKILEERCWSDTKGALTQAAGQANLDASTLLALHFGFFAPNDPKASTHVEAIRRELSVEGGLLRRYDVEDDFGLQQAAFTVCSFWMVEALALVGRRDEARKLFEYLLSLENGLGLFSEDILPATGEQSGNFPQSYSHVGLINAAFRLSRPWDDTYGVRDEAMGARQSVQR